MVESYKVLDGYGVFTGETTEKKSKFLAYIKRAESEEEATEFIKQIKKKHYDANHNCSAFVIGENKELVRCSDDGEPSGTAGKPMLAVLLGSDIVNIVAVVTRYFGGTKLGTGGLVRAYGGAVSNALESVKIQTVRSLVTLTCAVDYSMYERVTLAIESAGGKLEAPIFEENVKLSWQMIEGSETTLLQTLTEMTRGTGEIKISQPFFAAF